MMRKSRLPLALTGVALAEVSSSCQAFLLPPPTIATTILPPTFSSLVLYQQHDDDDDDGSSDLYHDIYWLDEEDEGERHDLLLGEAIGQGEAVIGIPHVATRQETRELFQAGLAAVQKRAGQPAARGRSRFSVSDPEAFSSNVVLLCEEVLLRVLDHLDDHIPSLYETLFVPTDIHRWADHQPLNAQGEQPHVPPPAHIGELCDSLRELYLMGELEWSEGEPAINVYQEGGYFGGHKDHLALTVLIPLTAPDTDFQGGGTGFWKGNRNVDENPSTPPDLVLRPDAGSALVFGGDVTHSGMPVVSGYRSVFVCSFSTKTPVSPQDRLHGMQAPPKVSPNFKGTM